MFRDSNSRVAVPFLLLVTIVFFGICSGNESYASNAPDQPGKGIQGNLSTITLTYGVLRIEGNLESQDEDIYCLVGTGTVNDYLIFEGTAEVRKDGSLFHGEGSLAFDDSAHSIHYDLYEGAWSFTPDTGLSNALEALFSRLTVSGVSISLSGLRVLPNGVEVSGTLNFQSGAIQCSALQITNDGVAFAEATLGIAGLVIEASGGEFGPNHMGLALANLRTPEGNLQLDVSGLRISATDVWFENATGRVAGITANVDQGHFSNEGLSVGTGSVTAPGGIQVSVANLTASGDSVSMSQADFLSGGLELHASGLTASATELSIQEASAPIPKIGTLTLNSLVVGEHFSVGGGNIALSGEETGKHLASIESSLSGGRILSNGIEIGSASLSGIPGGAAVTIQGLLVTTGGVSLASGEVQAGSVKVALGEGHFTSKGVEIGTASCHAPGGVSVAISGMTADTDGVQMESAAFSAGGVALTADQLTASSSGVSIGNASGTVENVGTLELENLVIGDTFQLTGGLLSAGGITAEFHGGKILSDGISVGSAGVSGIPGGVGVTVYGLLATSDQVILASGEVHTDNLTVSLYGGDFHENGFHVDAASCSAPGGIEIAITGLDASSAGLTMTGGSFSSGGLALSGSDMAVDSSGVSIGNASGTVEDVGTLELEDLVIGDTFQLTGGLLSAGGITAEFHGGHILPDGISVVSAGISGVSGGTSITVHDLTATSSGVTLGSGVASAGVLTISLADGSFQSSGVHIGSASCSTQAGVEVAMTQVEIDQLGFRMGSGEFSSGGLHLTASNLSVSSSGLSIGSAHADVASVGSITLEGIEIGEHFNLGGGNIVCGADGGSGGYSPHENQSGFGATLSGGKVLPDGIQVDSASLTGLPAGTSVSVEGLVATLSGITLNQGTGTCSGFNMTLQEGTFNRSGVDIGLANMSVSSFHFDLKDFHAHSGGVTLGTGNVQVESFALHLQDFEFVSGNLHIGSGSAELGSVSEFNITGLNLTSDGHFSLSGGGFKAGEVGAEFENGQILTNGISVGLASVTGLPAEFLCSVNDLLATSSQVHLGSGLIQVSGFSIELENGEFSSAGVDIGKGSLTSGSFSLSLQDFHVHGGGVNIGSGQVLAGGLDLELQSFSFADSNLSIGHASADVGDTTGFSLDGLRLTSSGNFSLQGGGFHAGGAAVSFTGGVFQSDRTHVDTASVVAGSGISISVNDLTITSHSVTLGKGDFHIYGLIIELDNGQFDGSGLSIDYATTQLSEFSANLEKIAISDHGFSLAGGGFHFSGLDAQFHTGEEDSVNNRLYVSASLTLPPNLGGVSAATTFYLHDGHIFFTDGQIDIPGPVGIPGTGLGFQNLYFSFNIPESKYEGGGEVSVPAFCTIGAALRIYEGYLDYLMVSASNFNPPISIGEIAFLDYITLAGNNLAHLPKTRTLPNGSQQTYYDPITFTGTFGLYAGPNVQPRVVSARIGTTLYDTGRFHADGTFSVLGFNNLASGWFEVSPKGQANEGFSSSFTAGLSYSCCGGLSFSAGGNASLRIPLNLAVSGSADAYIHIHAYIVSFDGNANLAFDSSQISGGFSIRSCVCCHHWWCGGNWCKCITTNWHFRVKSGNISVWDLNDVETLAAYEAAQAWSAGLRPMLFRDGRGYDFGTIQMGTNWKLADTAGWGRKKNLLRTGEQEYYDFLINPATTEQALFVCNYQRGLEPAILRLEVPGGDIFDESNTPLFDLNGPETGSPITYKTDSTMGTAVFHVIFPATDELQSFRLYIDNPEKIGDHTVELLIPNHPPIVAIGEIEASTNENGTFYRIAFSALDTDNPTQTVARVFLSSDYGQGTGIPIRTITSEEYPFDGSEYLLEIDQSQEDYPTGRYHIMLEVNDQYNALQYAYSDSRLLFLNPHAPAKVVNLISTEGEDSIALWWGEVTDATAYRVYWTDDLNRGDYRWSTDVGLQTNFVITEVTPGRYYRATVSAINSHGEGLPALPKIVLPGYAAVSGKRGTQERNHPPFIYSKPPLHVKPGQEYTYSVQVLDLDENPLVYELLQFPEGMNIDTSGLVSWVPSRADLGGATVSIRVTDFPGKSDVQSFVLIVSPERHARDSINILSSPSQIAYPGELYVHQVIVHQTGIDPSGADYILGEAPHGMTISATGTIQWTPDRDDLGSHWVTLIVRAEDGTTDFQRFVVYVRGRFDGDPNQDGLFDARDVFEIGRIWGTTNTSPDYRGSFDLQMDGKIDLQDLLIYLRNRNKARQ